MDLSTGLEGEIVRPAWLEEEHLCCCYHECRSTRVAMRQSGEVRAIPREMEEVERTEYLCHERETAGMGHSHMDAWAWEWYEETRG
jgi:hypothetical protein